MNKKNRLNFLSITLFTLIILLSQLSFAQIKKFQFEQIDSLQKINKKPVVVFLHTSWCKYCGTMENTTFKNADVIKLLNQKFYFVALDIEEKSAIPFHGHTFKYKPAGANTGVHELASQLGTINGQLAYPALCFLNADYEIIYQQQGYVQIKKFLEILKKLK